MRIPTGRADARAVAAGVAQAAVGPRDPGGRHFDLGQPLEQRGIVPGRRQLVYVPTPTQVDPEHFWILDLASMSTRRISSFDLRTTNRTFDITPDGMQIVFDRQRDNSDLVLIDLPERTR